MVTIKLKRTGRNKKPFFQIIVIENSLSTKSKYIEKLGYFDPLKKYELLKIDMNKMIYWISKGAIPSNRVKTLIKNYSKKLINES
ncbi:MAG TPA: 30S ribosomal protein S16 [Candidatus Azoamicus sp. OHIO1]